MAITNLISDQLNELRELGLSQNETAILAALLEKGEMTIGEIVRATQIKKGDAYNKLNDLVEKGLAEKNTKEKIMRFRLTHPNNLEQYIRSTAQKTARAKEAIEGQLPQIKSLYSLSYHQPGIKFFEGWKGMRKVMDDSLSSKGEIYTYLDPKSVGKYMDKLNRHYVAQRLKLKIRKRIIVADTTENRERYKAVDEKLTKIGYLGYDLPHFPTVMQIYDDKIAYLTLRPESSIGAIIEDPQIAKMHRALFEFNWSVAKKG